MCDSQSMICKSATYCLCLLCSHLRMVDFDFAVYDKSDFYTSASPDIFTCPARSLARHHQPMPKSFTMGLYSYDTHHEPMGDKL